MRAVSCRAALRRAGGRLTRGALLPSIARREHTSTV
jgi:hypothetical protein